MQSLSGGGCFLFCFCFIVFFLMKSRSQNMFGPRAGPAVVVVYAYPITNPGIRH